MALPTRRPRFTLFDELESLRREMDELLGTFGRRLPAIRGPERRWMPSTDVFEEDGQLIVRAELPGLEREDIRVTADQDVLTIEGERKREREIEEDRYSSVPGPS